MGTTVVSKAGCPINRDGDWTQLDRCLGPPSTSLPLP
jgi:hypothetical protein